MATFLDLALFEHVSSLFIFIFVWLVVYAFLTMSKLFKDVEGKSGIFALIALVVAFMSSFSGGFVATITTMVPWFTVMIIFFFLAFFIMRMFSTDDEIFKDLLTKGPMKWVLIIIFVIILLVSFSNAFGQKVLEDGTGQVGPTTAEAQATSYETTTVITNGDSVATNDFGTNMTQTLFHPKVLGMLLVILIAFFTILLIARTSDPTTQ